MRFTLVAVLAGVCALSYTTVAYEAHGEYHSPSYETPEYEKHTAVHGEDDQSKLDDEDNLKQYKNVLSLFKHIHQVPFDKQHVSMGKEYSIQKNLGGYTKPEAVKEFLHYYKKGMLPKDQVFSVFYDYHLKQAVALFKVFYYARDFETFYKTAVWARYHMNQGMFLYSFSVALIHRHDTYKMILPPIYEIYPYYFFNNEVIQKAQQYKQMWSNTDDQEQHGYTIYANYSGHYLNLHPEQSMSYFTEDVGVNAYYYYYNLYRPFWMNSEEYGIKTYQRGEEFYYFYQQFLARYYLERLSNGFGEIGSFDYQDAFETGYYPTMCYQNGLHFPQRPNWAKFFMNYYNHKQSFSMKGVYPYSYNKVVEYERRIRDAIDAGFVYSENGTKVNLFEPHGFNTLGNLIESNPLSVNARFYGYIQVFARHLLGYSFQPLSEYKVAPSALEHFETSLRDPAFWQLYKRIILYFQKYKYHLSHYTYDELAYSGVKIDNIVVDRLVTYFEKYDVDLTNAVYMNQNDWEHNNFQVRARQYRLNHKPFSYKIKVTSEKTAQAIVRVFIGPKYDEYGRLIQIDENRMNFVEFDKFKYELTTGQNTIERNSTQIFYAADRTTYKQLYQNAMNNVHKTEKTMDHSREFNYAFPNRFLLPKGKHGGQTYQFYVIVSPYKAFDRSGQKQQYQVYQKHTQSNESEYHKYPMVGLGVQYLDTYPLGYPFDKPIDEENFHIPNGYFQEVIIYHQHHDNVNVTNYQDNTYQYSYNSQKNLDYGYNQEEKFHQKYDTTHMYQYDDKVKDSKYHGSSYQHTYEPEHNQGYEPKQHTYDSQYNQGYGIGHNQQGKYNQDYETSQTSQHYELPLYSHGYGHSQQGKYDQEYKTSHMDQDYQLPQYEQGYKHQLYNKGYGFSKHY